jgi:hypothetical protein
MALHQDKKDFNLKPSAVDVPKDSTSPEIPDVIPSMPPIKIFSVLMVWLFCCAFLYCAPICGFPLIATISISHFGLIDAIFGGIGQVYGHIYDYLWIACTAILPIFIYSGSFTADLDEARILSRMQEHLSKVEGKNFLWRYFLHRNQDLLQANRAFEAAISGGLEQTNFETYLQTFWPEIYRRYHQPYPFLPGTVVQNVSGHVRTGHIRYTSRGPVNIRSHHVSGHTRVRNRR